MADAIHVVDENLRIVLINQAFLHWNRELGLEAHAVGKTIYEVFPFLSDRIGKEYQGVFETGQSLVTEERTTIGDREIVTETRKIPVFTGGRASQVLTIIRDVTEQRLNEAERDQLLAAEREQRIQAETLREVAAALITSLDLKRILPLILQQLARVVHYDSASIMLLADSRLNLVAHRSLDPNRTPVTPVEVESLPHVQTVLQRREPVIIADTQVEPQWQHLPTSSYIRCWMGVPLMVQSSTMGLLNLNHEQPGYYGQRHAEMATAFANQSATAIQNARLFEDLEHSHAALAAERALLARRVSQRTAALSAANAELARAARLKDEFLASMSHELRTPLNAVLGFAQALQEQVFGPLNERQMRSVDSIERSGRHLLALINDILDISKIEAGRIELEIGPVAVSAVCRASLQLIERDARKKQISVRFNVDTLRETSSSENAQASHQEALTVQADERRLIQVLVNLLSNAVKFTPAGGDVGLDVVSDVENEALRLTVWDTGIGIAENDMPRLFKPFVQLDSSLSRKFRGTGLGLSLVHRLVKLHAGSVSLESTIGHGSRFTVSLPWSGHDAGSKEPSPTKPTNRRPPSAPGEGNCTMLLVDDNDQYLDALSESLRARGCTVIVARNGAEAIQQARENQPGIVLIDVRLQGMDEVQVLHDLRSEAPFTVKDGTTNRTSLAAAQRHQALVVATTTLDFPGDQERIMRAGADAYVKKPVGSCQLTRLVEAWRHL
jgi:signal transduction histidine kinase/FixJ family two-component response regulator